MEEDSGSNSGTDLLLFFLFWFYPIQWRYTTLHIELSFQSNSIHLTLWFTCHLLPQHANYICINNNNCCCYWFILHQYNCNPILTIYLTTDQTSSNIIEPSSWNCKTYVQYTCFTQKHIAYNRHQIYEHTKNDIDIIQWTSQKVLRTKICGYEVIQTNK